MKNAFCTKQISTGLIIIALLFTSHFSQGQNIHTTCGNGTAGYSGDGGPDTLAEINFPGFLSFGGSGYGSLFIGDRLNYRVRQLKLGPGGIIFTKAGDGTNGFYGDSGPATAAEISIPGGVAVDKHNNVYFCDYDNHVVRKVDGSGIITTIAGTPGVAGFLGDGGPASAAKFNYPLGITVDSLGNLFVADQHNNRIRMISATGTISTVVGTGTSGFSGDLGPATAADISLPNYVRMDSVGNLYITDNGHHRIRKVDAFGIINTIAGNGTLGSSGDGGPATAAELNYPGGIAIDRQGNIFICDCYNNRIRRIDAFTGIISSVAGTGTAGYSGDWGPATAAELNQPVDVAVDYYNNVYFVDWNNSRIRTFNSPLTITCDTVTGLSVSSITSTSANLSWTAITGSSGYWYVVDLSSASPAVPGTFTGATTASVSGLPPGQNYYAHVLDSCGAGNLSGWATVPFPTLPISPCDAVTGLAVSSITSTSANLSWTAVTGSLGYEYTVDMSAASPSSPGTYVAASTVTVTGLIPGQNYYGHVLDSCGAGNLSAWVTVPFSTPSVTACDTVTGLSVSSITSTSATVSWTAVAGTLGYEYIVNTSAAAPTTPGTQTTATSIPVLGLLAGQSYYAHVLDSCGAGNLSAWVTVPFSTLSSSTGVGQVAGRLKITAFPNPVDDMLTIQINGKTGNNAQLILTDVAGKHVASMSVTGSTQIVDMKTLHPGVYFVRYIDDGHVQILSVIKA